MLEAISQKQKTCTAFVGPRRIASGDLRQVALKAKELVDQGVKESVLIFDDLTAHQVELDFRGTPADVLSRIQSDSGDAATTTGGAPDRHSEAADLPRGPGRPKLGVVAREVTLLPRHWQWLNEQPGGASVALRKLVEQAKRANRSTDLIRQSQESTYRFMSAMAGNEAGFEEATRALFAPDKKRFDEIVDHWPADIQIYAKNLAGIALNPPRQEPRSERDH
jgi:uncharacterized protein